MTRVPPGTATPFVAGMSQDAPADAVPPARPAASHPSSGGILLPVLTGWALAALILCLAMAGDIAGLRFPDPDDTMRMMEVRDWLAGQSWWDVAQHRFNHGDFPMHWSRLVDLPIAGVTLIAAPLFGPAAALHGATVVVPLLTLLAIMALTAAIARDLAGSEPARYAALLVALSVPIIYQARPLRIDHHGWQIVLALAAVALLLRAPTVRRGMLAGSALAALLTISLEGMPIAAAIAGTAALAWAWQPQRRGFLLGLVWSLFAVAAILHVATRGPAWLAPACDAMAPGWLAALGSAALTVSAATWVARFGPAIRLGALALGGIVTGGVLLLAAPGCTAGPFATLPPIVYRLWYLNVPEGRPIWEQGGYWAAMTVGLPIVGLAGTIRAMRAATGDAHDRWLILLVLLLAAFAVALLVNRAGATANALAVPGAAALMLALLHRARAIRSTGRRIAATLGALLIASPGQAGSIALLATNALRAHGAGDGGAQWARVPCERGADIRGIGRLPAGIVFAPIDLGPEIIAMTHHRGVAGGYHRGARPLGAVLAGFAAAPDAARRIVLASGADYLAVCPGLNEPEIYRRQFPHGLWARLERGERIAWLQPIALPGPALAWRVVRPLPSPTPRP